MYTFFVNIYKVQVPCTQQAHERPGEDNKGHHQTCPAPYWQTFPPKQGLDANEPYPPEGAALTHALVHLVDGYG